MSMGKAHLEQTERNLFSCAGDVTRHQRPVKIEIGKMLDLQTILFTTPIIPLKLILTFWSWKHKELIQQSVSSPFSLANSAFVSFKIKFQFPIGFVWGSTRRFFSDNTNLLEESGQVILPSSFSIFSQHSQMSQTNSLSWFPSQATCNSMGRGIFTKMWQSSCVKLFPCRWRVCRR